MKKQILIVSLLAAFCAAGCDSPKDPQKGETTVIVNNSVHMVLNPEGVGEEGESKRLEAGEWCLAYSGTKVTAQGTNDDKVLVVYEYDTGRAHSRPEKVSYPECPNNTIFFVDKRDFLWWQGTQKWIEEEKEAAKRIMGE